MSLPESPKEKPSIRGKLAVFAGVTLLTAYTAFAVGSTPDKAEPNKEILSMQTVRDFAAAGEDAARHPQLLPISLGVWLAEVMPQGE